MCSPCTPSAGWPPLGLVSLREQLKNICQLGAHGTEEFTRSQAKAVLGMSMALLAEPTVGFASEDELIEENH